MGLRAWWIGRKEDKARQKREIKQQHAVLFEGEGDSLARPKKIGMRRKVQKAHLERIEAAQNGFLESDNELLSTFRASGLGNPIISHHSLFRYTPNIQPTLFHSIAEAIGRRSRMGGGKPNIPRDRYFMKDRDVLGYKPGKTMPVHIGKVTCAVQGSRSSRHGPSLVIEYWPEGGSMQHGLIPYNQELLQKIERWMSAETTFTNERYNYLQKYGNQ
jgi:hypothetical protein